MAIAQHMTLGKIKIMAAVDRARDAALFSAIALAILGGAPALLAWWTNAGYEWWGFSAVLWFGATLLGLDARGPSETEIPPKRLAKLDQEAKRDLARLQEQPSHRVVTLASIDALIAARQAAREARRLGEMSEAQVESLR